MASAYDLPGVSKPSSSPQFLQKSQQSTNKTDYIAPDKRMSIAPQFTPTKVKSSKSGVADTQQKINDMIGIKPAPEPVTAVVNKKNKIIGVEDPNRKISRAPTPMEENQWIIQTQTTTTEQRLGMSLIPELRNLPAEQVINPSITQSINTADPILSNGVVLRGGTISRESIGISSDYIPYRLDSKGFTEVGGAQNEGKTIIGSTKDFITNIPLGFYEITKGFVMPIVNVAKFDVAYLAAVMQAPFVSKQTSLANISALQSIKPSGWDIAGTALYAVPFGGGAIGRGIMYGAAGVYGSFKTAEFLQSPSFSKAGKIAGGAIGFFAFSKTLSFAGQKAEQAYMGYQVSKLEAQPRNVVAIKTAFSAREAEAGFVPGYSVFYQRQTNKLLEKGVMNLKTFETGEGKIGFGLSPVYRTLEVKNFIGKNDIYFQRAKITGGAEILGRQPKYEKGTLVINDDIGKVMGSRSTGWVFQGNKQTSFESVGATRKISDNLYTFTSTSGGLKVRAYAKEAVLTKIDFVEFKAEFMQPMYYRGKLGAQGIIIDKPLRGIGVKEATFDYGLMGKKWKPMPEDLMAGQQQQAITMLETSSSKQELDAVASGIGSLSKLKIEAPISKSTFSSGAWTGLGTYERTDESASLLKPTAFTRTLSLSRQSLFTPTLITDIKDTFAPPTAIFSTPDLISETPYQPQGIAQSLNINQALKTPSSTPAGYGFDFPIPSTPFEVPPIFIPTLSIDLTGELAPRRTGKQKKKRTPTLFAAITGMTTSAPSAAEVTGFVSRPILVRRKR